VQDLHPPRIPPQNLPAGGETQSRQGEANSREKGFRLAEPFHQTATTLGLTHYHTYPRSPKMNAHVERFNRTLSEEWIVYHRASLRDDVSKANQLLIDYLLWYNTKRPHASLGLRSPFAGIVERLKAAERQKWWTYTASVVDNK